MILATLSFLAGLLLVQQFTALPDPLWSVAGFLAVIPIVWRRHRLCLCFAIGVLWAILFAAFRLSEQLPKHVESVELPVTGYISDLPEQTEKYARFNFNINPSTVLLPRTVRLSWYHPDQPIKAGQHWSFTIKLKRPHGSLNKGAFDYEQWLFAAGIGATGTVRNKPSPVLQSTDSAWRSTEVWRQYLTDHLDATLDKTQHLALIKALTLGDGSNISQADWDIFRKTGTTHLIVISGSHIGLIAGLIYWLTLKSWARTGLLRWSPPKVAAGIALIATLLYSALAGFSIPTQRAMIMLTIVMTATVLQRNHRPLHTLAIAMWGVLLIDPLAVLSPGFWLSFLAVALIIFTISARLKTPSALISTLKINWATSVGLSPLLLLFFQQISLISPLANFIAVPVISFIIVPLALVAAMILPLSANLAWPLFWITDKALQVLMVFLTHLANWPLSTLNHTAPSPWTLVFIIPSVLLLLAPVGVPARSLALILLLPSVFTQPDAPSNGQLKMTVLDVGQGLAVSIQTAHHWLVYDTGPQYSSGGDSGQTVLLPFFRHQQVRHIDTLILSHGDSDHTGGAQSVLDTLAVKQLITSVPTQFDRYHPIPCQDGQSWQWDGVQFTVLAPLQPFQSDNDNSCVLRIDSPQTSILLTGDIEATAEYDLVARYQQKLKADILIAPHHGSKTSSTLAFLKAVAPKTILISAGYLNSFSHPHRDVIARYDLIQATVLNTADSGAITLTTENMAHPISTLRDTDSKYWNNRKSSSTLNSFFNITPWHSTQ